MGARTGLQVAVVAVAALLLLTAVASASVSSRSALPEGVLVRQSPQDYFDKLIGGIQIQIYIPIYNEIYTCSVGFPAYYYQPPTAPDRPGFYVFGIVTASHCGQEGFPVYQPYMAPQYYRGYFDVDPGHPRLTDSAFVATEYSTDLIPYSVDDKVLYYGMQIPILGYITVNNLRTGTIVYKTGAATGTNYGEYLGTTYIYDLVDPFGDVIYILNAIKSSNAVESGDSGGTLYIVEYFWGWYYAWVLGIVNGYYYARYDAITIYYAFSSPYDHITYDLGVNPYG